MGECELLGGPSILLVEDHPFQLIGLEMQLNRLGFFKLTQALDAAEALMLIRAGRSFDLLLCDQNLPDALGIDLIEQAYKLGGIRYAMLISGVEHPDLLQKLPAVRRGDLPLLACLCKPLSPELFMSSIKPLWSGA